MKKILSILLFCVLGVTSNAENAFEMLPVPELKIDRPYIDLTYSQIHALTMEKADKEAYFEGALRYYYGYVRRLDIPFPKDYAAAAIWFYESGMLNHKQAAYFLGNMYLQGQGVEKNSKDAYWWLEKSSELGLQEATLQLANLYYYSSLSKDLPDSYKDVYLTTSIKYFTQLANQGYAYAYYGLALIKLRSTNVTRFVRADANSLLMQALYGLIALNDKVNCYEILKVMKYYKLDDYNKAISVFNKTFPKNIIN
jgi:TPR repeat protein